MIVKNLILMKTRISFTYLSALLLLSLLSWHPLQAGHIVGGELFYECLGYTNGDPNSGSRTYRFYMKLYRDALGGGADFDSAPGNNLSASVTIFQGASTVPFTTQYLEAPIRTTINLNPGNVCLTVPPTVEVEEGLYTFRDIELPIINESYFIVYQRCCRNQALSNINDPGSSGATYFIELSPPAQQICNNSPLFEEFPPFIICANEPFEYDLAAQDADGHRLEYEFCTPFLGGGPDNDRPFSPTGIAPDPDSPPPFEPVSFIEPTFSAIQPLGNVSNFTVDPNTGIITGMPVVTGQFVIGLCVREYDENDQLLGEVRRDFQFLVTDCERSIVVDIPSDSLNADGAFVLNTCDADGVQIANNSTQSDIIDEFFWEFDIAGQTQTYNEFSPSVDFAQPGNYQGRFVIRANSGCVDTGLVSVQVIEAAQADFEISSDPCEDEVLRFSNTSSVPSGLQVSYVWEFGDGSSSTAVSPTHTYATAGSREVQLLAISNSACRDSTTRSVDFFPLPRSLPLSAIQGQGCLPQDANFRVSYPFFNAQYSINWDFGDGDQASGAQVSHTYTLAGDFTPQLLISAPSGCMLDSVLAPITITAAPVADFRFSPMEPSSLESTVDFTDNSVDAQQWSWQFGAYGSSSQQNPSFTFPDSAGIYPVQLTVTHQNGCMDTLVREVVLRSIDDLYLPNAFSPNNDGINDEFRSFGPLGGKQDFAMTIFTRWGGRVFYTTDPSEGWNGRQNNTGDFLPQGVYVYYLTFKNQNGEQINLKGLLNLLK